MLQVIFGTDVPQVRARALARADEAVTQGATLYRIEAEQYQSGQLLDALGATSLFGGTSVYLLDTPSAHADFQADVLANLTELHAAGDTYIVIETSLLAAERKPYEKVGATLEESKAEAQKRFDVFALADALARKDKKSLWILWHAAERTGTVPEEIIGMLWWQLKTLRLAAVTKTAAEAGMKDYPYNKAKRALSSFTVSELEALSHSLIALYHEGHQGEVDISLALERWILRI